MHVLITPFTCASCTSTLYAQLYVAAVHCTAGAIERRFRAHVGRRTRFPRWWSMTMAMINIIIIVWIAEVRINDGYCW